MKVTIAGETAKVSSGTGFSATPLAELPPSGAVEVLARKRNRILAIGVGYSRVSHHSDLEGLTAAKTAPSILKLELYDLWLHQHFR